MITLAGAGAIIKDSNDHVFLVKIKRRGMVRWELPTRVSRKGESIFLALYRCIDEESSSQLVARIGRPVCLGLNSSSQLGYQYFAMFYECKAEAISIKLTEDTDVYLPEEVRQQVLDSSFVDWQKLPPIDIHPQHREILSRWYQTPGGPLFSVVSDADSELAFYNDTESVQLFLLDTLASPVKNIKNKKTSLWPFNNKFSVNIKPNEDKNMDPITILSSINTTLGIVDKFTDLVKKTLDKDNTKHRVQTKKDGECLKILHNGNVIENIHISKFNLSEWDDMRYATLKRKIDASLAMFNDIDENIPMASVDEKARLKQKLMKIRKDLCEDFRELIALHERTLGVSLGDHYGLHRVCDGL